MPFRIRKNSIGDSLNQSQSQKEPNRIRCVHPSVDSDKLNATTDHIFSFPWRDPVVSTMAEPALHVEKRLDEELSYPILLLERVRSAAAEAQSFRTECAELSKQMERLAQMLRPLVRFATSSPPLYERPIRRVIAEVSANVERSLSLARKCRRRQNILRRLVGITTAADFRKVSNLIEASIGDMRWLLSVYCAEDGGGIVLSLPPIAATNDPILSWVWSFLASIHMGPLPVRIQAATELASLAEDNDRNKKIIVEEGGVPPLLKLLKEGTSPDAQIAAANLLSNLANDHDRVQSIVDELGVPTIVQVLGDSAMRVQIQAAGLVAKMAANSSIAREEFARENAVRPLVRLLSFETFGEELRAESRRQSMHSIVNMYSSYTDRRERETEQPEIKLKLKTTSAAALWMLARDSLFNSRKITETKGLLCLGKLIDSTGELQYNCLMTIMEITAVAEKNQTLRCTAFRTNSPAAKLVVDQLLRVVTELETPSLQIAAVKSLGSLARIFPARESRVVVALVSRLGHVNQDIATEAAISLEKFASRGNYVGAEHAKVVIESGGLPPLMGLLRGTERAELHSLTLLCNLALLAGNSESFEHDRVLMALEGAMDRSAVAQAAESRELIGEAIYHLKMYHSSTTTSHTLPPHQW